MVLYIEHQSPSTGTSSHPNSYNQPSKPIAISPRLRNKRKRSDEFQHYKRIKSERLIISQPEFPESLISTTFQQPKNGILHQKPLGHSHTADHDDPQVYPAQSNITPNTFRPITPPPQMSQPLEFEPSPSCEAENYMLEGYNVWSRNSSTTTVNHRDPTTDSDEDLHDY